MLKEIKFIMHSISDEDIVISSTGMVSRVVFHTKDRDLNFYVQGSMGASLGIGIGVALNTKREVHVIAGDGDILMSLGTLALMNKLKLPNLRVWIMDNNCYCATGGQPTCSDSIDFRDICSRAIVYNVDPQKPEFGRITLTPQEIRKRFENAVLM